MNFDPNNSIVKLCIEGMKFENEGKHELAFEIFQQSWNEASNDFEKFIAAHYVARHQNNVFEKLVWDKKALTLALKINSDDIKSSYPSLYLNIGKCYEDLNDLKNAKKNYELALPYITFLGKDPYGNMIKIGILNAIKRVKEKI